MITIDLNRLLSRVRDFRVDLTWFTLLDIDTDSRTELQDIILQIDQAATDLEGCIALRQAQPNEGVDTVLAMEAAVLTAAVERCSVQADMRPPQVIRLARAVHTCLKSACERLRSATAPSRDTVTQRAAR
jgi:hypothetical protein